MKEVVDKLLTLKDSSLDARMMPLIKQWSDPPTPLQILEVLDHCIHGALASGFIVAVLQSMYELTCKRENTTHEEVVKGATWRG